MLFFALLYSVFRLLDASGVRGNSDRQLIQARGTRSSRGSKPHGSATAQLWSNLLGRMAPPSGAAIAPPRLDGVALASAGESLTGSPGGLPASDLTVFPSHRLLVRPFMGARASPDYSPDFPAREAGFLGDLAASWGVCCLWLLHGEQRCNHEQQPGHQKSADPGNDGERQ